MVNVENILSFERLDSRIGYKVSNREGDSVGLFRNILGEWRYKPEGKTEWTGSRPEALVMTSLRQAMKDDGFVSFWSCCDCEPVEMKPVFRELANKGAVITHGYCDKCFANFRSKFGLASF